MSLLALVEALLQGLWKWWESCAQQAPSLPYLYRPASGSEAGWAAAGQGWGQAPQRELRAPQVKFGAAELLRIAAGAEESLRRNGTRVSAGPPSQHPVSLTAPPQAMEDPMAPDSQMARPPAAAAAGTRVC